MACGDVNQDGIVYTVGDMVHLLRWINGEIHPDSTEACGDVNLCGDVNIADILLYEKYFVWGLGVGICQPAENCVLPTGSNAVFLECPEYVYAHSFDSVAVDLYITSEVDLGGFSIGLTHDSPNLDLLGIDISNSSISASWNLFGISPTDSDYVQPFPDDNAILLMALPDIDYGLGSLEPMPAGEHVLIARLWYSYPDLGSDESVDFSDVFVPTAGELLFAPWDGGVIEPLFNDAGEQDMNLLVRDCGDPNQSGGVDIDDIVYLLNCVFVDCLGPEPWPDPNCDGILDIDDIVFMIAHIFQGGPLPCDTNQDGEQDYGCGA